MTEIEQKDFKRDQDGSLSKHNFYYKIFRLGFDELILQADWCLFAIIWGQTSSTYPNKDFLYFAQDWWWVQKQDQHWSKIHTKLNVPSALRPVLSNKS